MASDRVALLAWPDGYGSPSRKPGVLIGIPFFAVVAVVFVAMLISSIADRNALQIVFFGGGALAFASFVAGFISIRNVRQTKLPSRIATGADSDQALTLPMSRPFAISFAILLISGTVFFLTYAIVLLTRDYPNDANKFRGYLFAAILVVLSVAAAWLSWTFFSSLTRATKLAIGPDGIELDNGSVHQTIGWAAIRDVRAAVTANNPALIIEPSDPDTLHTLHSSVLVRRLNQRYLREMIIDVHFYGIDPAVLYHLVRFYWQNPDARSELASNTVLDRMRSGDLVS
ncbi:hypothetical protein [Nocardia wallacei]|uniref:hypothetical protein n=1 Tax=Nocardia wallacei TaxID=480035 RepID=UPI002456ECBA|nr:hypothetical protein [Nocardia wallacei]